MVASAPILSTKLYIPPPPPKVVLRPRLGEQLDEGTSLLKIRVDKGDLLILVALLFACLRAGQGVVTTLPPPCSSCHICCVSFPGALTFVTILAYSAALGRFNKSGFFSGIITGFIGLLIVKCAVILLPFPRLSRLDVSTLFRLITM